MNFLAMIRGRSCFIVLFVIGCFNLAQGRSQTERSLLQEPIPKKWNPGYVSSTLADALADVMRAKAEHKYSKPETVQIANVAPTPAVPSKSKDFTFTNIRLRTSATGDPDIAGMLHPGTGYQHPTYDHPMYDHPQPMATSNYPQPTITPTQTPGTGTPSPFTTQNVATAGTVPRPIATTVPVPQQQLDPAAELSRKLDEYRRLTEEMQRQIEALKQHSSGMPPTGRRLQDAGGPGWDYGLLLEKKLELLQQEAAALHEDIQKDWAAVMNMHDHRMSDHQASMDVAMDDFNNRWTSKHDMMQDAMDAWRDHAESAAGNFQDTLARLMEMRSERKMNRWENHNWFG